MHTHNTEELQPLTIFFSYFFCTTLIYIKRYRIAITIITAPDVPSSSSASSSSSCLVVSAFIMIIDGLSPVARLCHSLVTRFAISSVRRRSSTMPDSTITYRTRTHARMHARRQALTHTCHELTHARRSSHPRRLKISQKITRCVMKSHN